MEQGKKGNLKEEGKNDAAESTDNELDELLDNALSDFNNASSAKKDESSIKTTDVTGSGEGENSSTVEPVTAENFESFFAELMKQAMNVDNAENTIDVNTIMEEFVKMSEGFEGLSLSPEECMLSPDEGTHTTEEGAHGAEEGPPAKEFSCTMNDTLKNMVENAENLQKEYWRTNMQCADGELSNLIRSLGFPEEGVGRPGGDTELNPFFQQIMNIFLSREVLYPPMKDLVNKFPEWLSKNEDKIDRMEYTRRVEQLELLKKVCAEFEKEQPTDSAEVKSQRSKTLLDLMQQLKEYGHPPMEMIGEVPLNFDESGMPVLPMGTDQDQCSVM